MNLVAKSNRILFSQFWRLEVQNQGVSRATPYGGSGREFLCPFILLVAPGVACVVDSSLQSLPPCPHGLLLAVSLFVSNLLLLSLIRIPVTGFRVHPKSRLISLKSLNWFIIYKDLFSKSGHIHRFQGLRHRHIILVITNQLTTYSNHLIY